MESKQTLFFVIDLLFKSSPGALCVVSEFILVLVEHGLAFTPKKENNVF